MSREEMDIDFEELREQIEVYLREENLDGFRELFTDLHNYEQSEIFQTLSEEEQQNLYKFLSPEEVGDFFDHLELEPDEYEDLFDQIDARYAAHIIGAMQYDNAVDILNEISREKMTTYLSLMNKDDAKEIRGLMNYEEDTAGGIMTTEIINLNTLMTVREAMKHIKEMAPDKEMIYYLFVVDQDNHLVGIISLRELIVADDDDYIGDVMTERVVSVRISDDQEEVAQIVRDYDFLAVPVVDFQDHLVGIITADDIMDVIHEEAGEDYSRLAGMSDNESTSDTALMTAKKRLPWLIGLTFMGMITAWMLSFFEDTLAKVVLLSAFIPVISGMAGNTGTQSLAVAIRGISTGEIKESSKMKLAGRELGSGFLTGLVCGVVIFLIIIVMYQEPVLGIIVSGSLLASMSVATIIGTIVPLVMNKAGIDPAIASGPFITTANDIISLLIYFALANVFMASLL
ncbi:MULTISPECIES: magnesium transporter [Jeotgalicoccus]|uniref:magnesium transporter n=1 Tax=Jeotgalicoccus TaxID=227979 RepID=UPI000423EBFF|nr:MULTISPECIES: magnesium transporter [Jeotgalicoccus]QQD85905.1 magnesium transporter [Jeotgalicoccus sp. ATCC 8456]